MQTTLIRNSINFKVFVFHTRYFSIPKLHLVLFLFSHKTFYCISCERGGTSKTWQFISNLLIFTSFAEHNWKLEVEAVAKPYIYSQILGEHTQSIPKHDIYRFDTPNILSGECFTRRPLAGVTTSSLPCLPGAGHCGNSSSEKYLPPNLDRDKGSNQELKLGQIFVCPGPTPLSHSVDNRPLWRWPGDPLCAVPGAGRSHISRG